MFDVTGTATNTYKFEVNQKIESSQETYVLVQVISRTTGATTEKFVGPLLYVTQG